MSPVSKNRLIRYEWVLIYVTRPVRKVRNKNAISSSDCQVYFMQAPSVHILETTNYALLWVHGRYTYLRLVHSPLHHHFVSRSHPPDVTHVMNEIRPSLFFALFRLCVLCWMQTEERKPKNENGGGLGTRLLNPPNNGQLQNLMSSRCSIQDCVIGGSLD